MTTMADLMKSHYRGGASKQERYYRYKRNELILSKTKPNILKTKDKELCLCKICHKTLSILTHVHAENHGYKDKYEMIADGKVEFLYKGDA